MSTIKLAVIIGSTREGRRADVIANWFTKRVEQSADFDIDMIDLADPLLGERHPMKSTPELDRFNERVADADAFVVLTPEYNHGYPASLKFAIDSCYYGWQAKPVGFVSYGGISGGLRAVEQLRQVFAELHAVSVRDTVSFHNVFGAFDGKGEPHSPDEVNAAAKTMLDQIRWWAETLREGRAKRAYTT
ncbi:NAD(P)H-dependent oxidoreductase [Allokutzneria sp. A3M-2-11 16]|uniref:NADPH-dependent FMN reductase n=1 Tax=Allokutzneria sp. A3M-2-11 16 TaxID=2962043 RepID=UPI0020B8A61A|nr:NAD(P)H-dependent oxidoreductase [Allokutzneria sp. A3M-2-11 16]MCP3800868.1 NAD(P)H-dependent oxidoreductase [Allokutzneria sp. A3M-2-11 16]